jgi:hypothetical protein
VKFLAAVFAVVTICACNQAKLDPAVLRQAVVKHVTEKAGLSTDAMSIELKNVKIEGSKATTDVVFVPKSMPAAAQTWTYQLESKDGQWIVVGKGLAKGSMHSDAPPANDMPPGHPPVPGK